MSLFIYIFFNWISIIKQCLVLGFRCFKVKPLKSAVTDTGIEWFCCGCSKEGIKCGGECMSIQNTVVTDTGVQICLIHWPSLQVLNHKSSLQALGKATPKLIEGGLSSFPVYSLSRLFISISKFDAVGLNDLRSLKLALSLCQSLIHFFFSPGKKRLHQ